MFEGEVRSGGHSEAVKRALADVGRTKVSHPRRQRIKLKKGGFKGVILPKDEDITSLPAELVGVNGNPNELVKVVVELPAGMVAAAGDKLNQYVWEGVRDRLGDSWLGFSWFEPRFLVRVKAKAMRARDEFTL